jgi:hypothetical protein
MIGDNPTPEDKDSMAYDPLAKSAAAAPGRPVEGRRINFLAWGIAGVAGVAMWVLILKGL